MFDTSSSLGCCFNVGIVSEQIVHFLGRQASKILLHNCWGIGLAFLVVEMRCYLCAAARLVR